MTRRNFTTALAGTAALQAAGPAAAQSDRKVGFCIIGLGTISMQHFMPGVVQSQKCRLTGIVSGHRDKAERMAAQFNIPTSSIYSYETIERIADNKDIDAVYIALPNSMHAEYTIKAAKAGKHVLCEKPMATSVADSEAMIGACKQANRKLMIAYRCQYEANQLAAIDLIKSGKLGKVELIQASYGFNIGRNQWRCNKKLAGGGPLMDVGIYALNACRYLTGEEPVISGASSSVIDQDGRFNEVEENLTWTMKFPSGAVASCATTYGGNMPPFFRVYGSRGTLHCEPAFNYSGQQWTARMQGQAPVENQSTGKDPYQFTPQADHLAECIFDNKEPHTPGEEGLRDMKLMADIYRACDRG
jgi:predicted dehydrogenase